MKVDWPYVTTPFAYSAVVDTRGPLVSIQLMRISDGIAKPWAVTIVAEADGPVRSAFLDPRGYPHPLPKGCHVNFGRASLGQGYHALVLVGDNPDGWAQTDFPDAIFGGPVDELHPKVLKSWSHLQIEHSATASAAVWATDGQEGNGAAKWGEPWQVVSPPGDPGWGMDKFLLGAHDDFVWSMATSGIYDGIMAWTPTRGSYPFLLYPGDYSHGADALGTDGIDMVWIDETGKGPAQEPYAVRSIMTAPYTTDPAALVPRRLRSFPTSEPQGTPFRVGCGYAAMMTYPQGVLVVRLSDGWSWSFWSPAVPPTPSDWGWAEVFGITCDELFVQGGVGKMNIARVRLDALGSGNPPD